MIEQQQNPKVMCPPEKQSWKGWFEGITKSYKTVRYEAVERNIDVSELDRFYNLLYGFLYESPACLAEYNWNFIIDIDRELLMSYRHGYEAEERRIQDLIYAAELEKKKEETLLAIPEPPKYQGMTKTPDIFNTGIVSTNQGSNLRMNKGDWIMFAGIQQGIWLHGDCYEWTGTSWLRIPYTNSDAYMAANFDITENAPNSEFFKLQVRYFFGSQATVDQINALQIILRNPGFIQSQDYRAAINGFKMWYNGNAEFNNITARGHIEASSGTFHGRLEGLEGYIKTTLNVGDRWNNNGGNNNLNAPGFFVPGTGSGTGYWVRATSLVVEDTFGIGDLTKERTNAEFNNTLIKHNGTTHTETQSIIEGTYTLVQLNTQINNKLGLPNQPGYRKL